MSRRKLLIPIVLMIGFIAALSASVHAQCSEVVMVTASNASQEDRFGRSVSISGDYAIAGAPEVGQRAGRAYVYHRVGSDWVQEQILVSDDIQDFDLFGWSVGLSGDYAVVSATGIDGVVQNSGGAYVFHRSGSTWTQQAQLIPNDASVVESGSSVAIDGDVAAIGAIGAHNNEAVYVFGRVGTVWTEVQKLVPSGPVELRSFGASVAISNDLIVVGAPFDSTSALSAGAAYVFRRDDNGTPAIPTDDSWTEEAKLTAKTPAVNDNYGIAVDVNAARVAIGALQRALDKDNAGIVYIYRYDNPTWVEEAEIRAGVWDSGDGFGRSVALEGDLLVVGADSVDTTEPSSGALYFFDRIGSSWLERARVPASDSGDSYQFGHSVALSGNYAIGGSPGHQHAGPNSGAAFLVHVDVCTAQECATEPICRGACCDATPSCEISWVIDCRAAGDDFLGTHTVCAEQAGGSESCSDGLDNDCDDLVDCADLDCLQDPACELFQACCLPSSQCSELLVDDCLSQSGIPQGEETRCSESPGPSCNDGVDNDCDGLSDCDDPDCDLDAACVGACCLPDGSCEFNMARPDCDALGGTLHVQMSCVQVSCPQPEGACCVVGGGCALATEEDCLASPDSGWAGPFTGCGDSFDPTEDVGASCSDNVDNDCDGRTDCADADCAVDEACILVPAVSGWSMVVFALTVLVVATVCLIRRAETRAT